MLSFQMRTSRWILKDGQVRCRGGRSQFVPGVSLRDCSVQSENRPVEKRILPLDQGGRLHQTHLKTCRRSSRLRDRMQMRRQLRWSNRQGCIPYERLVWLSDVARGMRDVRKQLYL